MLVLDILTIAKEENGRLRAVKGTDSIQAL